MRSRCPRRSVREAVGSVPDFRIEVWRARAQPLRSHPADPPGLVDAPKRRRRARCRRERGRAAELQIPRGVHRRIRATGPVPRRQRLHPPGAVGRAANVQKRIQSKPAGPVQPRGASPRNALRGRASVVSSSGQLELAASACCRAILNTRAVRACSALARHGRPTDSTKLR